jgi:hypothetical protein
MLRRDEHLGRRRRRLTFDGQQRVAPQPINDNAREAAIGAAREGLGLLLGTGRRA